MTRAVRRRVSAQDLLVLFLFALLVLGVARTQPRLARTVSGVKAREDVYPFPPPSQLKLATLGHTSAACDLLWAKLLVEYGVHWGEHRPFPDLNKYLDALVALDPKYKHIYEFIDTMLVYRPLHGTEEDARAARAYLEGAVKVFPYDHELWLHYGQFIAFMGPSYLPEGPERDRWREEGAHAMERAAELGADVDKTLVAANMLSRRFGERDAAVKALERAYAVTDDEAVRAEIAAKLEVLEAGRARERAECAAQAVKAGQRDFPFLTWEAYLRLGPFVDRALCAGPSSASRRECQTRWDDVIAESCPP